MKNLTRKSKNVIDMSDSGPNAKKAIAQKKYMMKTEAPQEVYDAKRTRELIAGRKKLDIGEASLRGMPKAKEADKKKAKALDDARLKQYADALLEAKNKRVLLGRKTPDKAPIPSKNPRRK